MSIRRKANKPTVSDTLSSIQRSVSLNPPQLANEGLNSIAIDKPIPVIGIQRSVSLNPPQLDISTEVENISPESSVQQSTSLSEHYRVPTDVEQTTTDDTRSSFDTNLESIANCSRIKQVKSLNTLYAVGAAAQKKYRTRTGTPSITKRRGSNRLARRRNRSGRSSRTGTDSETNASETGIEEDMTGLVGQYDIIATDEIAKLGQSLHRMKTSSSPCDLGGHPDPAPTTSEGVRAIQSGFFQLLKDFILILPDSAIIEVLAHYVTVEVVLVLANHRDAVVRTSIVRLLAHISQRLSDNRAIHCQKQHYWLHLGNQVALHPVSAGLVQASCQWVTGGSSLAVEQMVNIYDCVKT